ncbi:hypothetical protein COB64_02515 [Candidatus Wolfebacteria bacterium]|nr:MAG: hypothetical protein COB64_02515 [Candidatus Wolfebacteria bacterium]
MRIGTKLLLIIGIVSFIGITIGGIIYYFITRQAIEERIVAQLESITILKENQLNNFISEEMDDVIVLSSDEALLNNLINFNTYQKDEHKEAIQDILINKLQIDRDFLEFFIMDFEGKVVISTDPLQEGKIKYSEHYFREGKIEVFVQSFYYDTALQEPAMTIGLPLRNKEGEVINVFAGRVNLEDISELMVEKTGLGETGETYLVNKFNFMVTESRFYEGFALRKAIHTDSVKNCLKKQTQHGIYKNYLDEEVIGRYRWIARHEVCLLAEIGKSEAFEPLDKIVFSIAALSSALLALYITLGFFAGKAVARPIRTLTDNASALSGGDLDIKIDPLLLSKKDEVGQLAMAFNSMVVNLKKSHVNLEEKIALLKKEKEKIGAILQSISDGVFVIDRKHSVTMFNKIAEEISGFSSQEVLGNSYENVLKFVTEKKEKANDSFLRDAMETGEIKEVLSHTQLIRKDGSKVSVGVSAAPLKDSGGGVVGAVIVFRDITREREIDRAKTEFVSLASHQLRTPLSSISWYTEMLLDDGSSINRDVQKKYLRKIYQNNKRMVELVNAFLDVSRLDIGTLIFDIKPVDFKKIADSTIDELTTQMSLKKITLSTHYDQTLPEIQADSKAIGMIFQNLLSNAIKYNRSGGTITLSIEKKEPHILITVSDTGYGIPRSHHSKIFSKFFRVDNIKKYDTDGNGLGLYIVKSIVKQMNGKIWFESIEDKGSTFYVQLPLSVA